MAAIPRFLAAVCLSFTIAAGHVALHAQDEKTDDAKAEHKDDKQVPVPPESAVVTHHEWKAAGAPVAYTATAGNLVIHDDDDKPYGSVFYVAYTKDGVADAGTRPITFLYNGGPGAATIWLHMGSVGPMRVVTSSPDATGSAPYKLVPNEYSLLGKTDLVFIDAVGTGFSKPVGKATEKDFAGTDEDIKAFERFIERYITVNKRWNSPKYLMGESYGTTRSAALADALQEKGIELNGVVLISSILNYGVRVPGYDTEPIVYLPSYAAIAWFHNKLAQKPADLKSFLEEVRRYARGPYAEALAQGDALPEAEKDAVAQKLSAYTGLSVEYLKQTNLRINPSRFRKELLRGEREIMGRYDARFEGTDVDAAGETPAYDPSDTGISGAFVAAFHDYLAHDLKRHYGGYVLCLRAEGERVLELEAQGARPREPIATTLCGGRSGGCDAQEPKAEGLLSEWVLRPGDAVLLDRIRPGPHVPGAGVAQQCGVRLLPGGPHDLSEPRGAEGVSRGYEPLLHGDCG